jgi:hypothetical protein
MIEPGPTDPTDRDPIDQGADDMATTEVEGPSGPAGIVAGTRVEVRNRLDGTWSRGFEVVGRTDDGYRIRRLSDGTPLPVVFGDDDLRPERERRRGTWWY